MSVVSSACESGSSLIDLDRRGYVLIRGFLNADEIEQLSRDFETARVNDNSNYHVRRLSEEMNALVGPKCLELAAQIKKESSVDVDTINDSIYFATFTNKRTLTSPQSGRQAFPWHQDHENFWQWQDSKNYLNFYIPVVKPCLEQSNLGLMPFDKIRARNPQLGEKVIGLGASRILKKRGDWVLRDDTRDRTVGKLGFDPSEIEEIPHLAPGDLLLMRGDVIHCTQDANTRRIAISLRLINGRVMVSRSRMVRGGLVKGLMMFNARSLFGPMLEYFAEKGATRLEAAELNDLMDRIRQSQSLGKPGTTNFGRVKFLRMLVTEKLRALVSRD